MELMPALRIGWLNGWIPLALLCMVDVVLFLALPREVVRRLFDRSGWSREQIVLTVVGKLFASVCLALIVLTPLKLGSPVFIAGAVLVVCGLGGLATALLNFAGTPPDQPVTRGLYTISRHPQIFMSSLVLLGACLAIGSWPALLALVIARACGHLGILAEEEICLEQYGESYRAYMARVPRYFLLF